MTGAAASDEFLLATELEDCTMSSCLGSIIAEVEGSDLNQPYLLDGFKYRGALLPALTEKNAKFIDAVVRLDSSYREKKEPKAGFDPEKNSISIKGDRGSTAYWFEQMFAPNPKYEYKTCLLGAIIAIDTVNSTHLEASLSKEKRKTMDVTKEDGTTEKVAIHGARERMRKLILKECPNVDALRKKLKDRFSAGNEKHLISLMAKPFEKGENAHLSFASKFCFYASKYLLNGKEPLFSKYDQVVRKKLPAYLKKYQVVPNETVTKATQKIFDISGKTYKDQLAVYEEYNNQIGLLIDKLASPLINREAVDHIIWYVFK